MYSPRTRDSKNFGILIMMEIRTTGTTYLNNRRLFTKRNNDEIMQIPLKWLNIILEVYRFN